MNLIMLDLMFFHRTIRDYLYCFYLLIIYGHPRYLAPCYVFLPPRDCLIRTLKLTEVAMDYCKVAIIHDM